MPDAPRLRLLQPDLVAAFVEEYRLTTETAREEKAAGRAKVERAKAKVTARIGCLTDMMTDGICDFGR